MRRPTPGHGVRRRQAIVCSLAVLLLGIETGTVQQVRLTDRPITISVAVPDRIDRGATLLLRIDGVTTEPSQTATIRVFLDRPSADQSTAVSDPQFIGYFTVVPRHAGGSRKDGQNFILEIPERMVATLKRASVQITLVPVSGSASGPGMTIKRISLEPPR